MTMRSLKSGWHRLKPPLLSLQVMGDTQDKSSAYAALGESEVDDYLADILDNVTCDCQE